VVGIGDVILDSVGTVVCGVLGNIDQAVLVVLDVVVTMLLDGLGLSAFSFKICMVAPSSFIAIGFHLCGMSAASAVCIRGGTLLRCKWQRRREGPAPHHTRNAT